MQYASCTCRRNITHQHTKPGSWGVDSEGSVRYDNSTSKIRYIFYLDGAKYDQRTVKDVAFKDASVLVLGGFQQAANIKGTYNDNPWMSPFLGVIDQVRLYGTVLSATDVSALFTGKM